MVLTILGWYSFILSSLIIIFHLFGNDEPKKRFINSILLAPVVVYLGFMVIGGLIK